jgi:ParB-like chromosome segregation protein Spo0J
MKTKEMKDHILKDDILMSVRNIISRLENADLDSKVDILNSIKEKLHDISPFQNEPVDCVLWVKNESIHANDYNPNAVAPPEMELLRLSINNDGYTQPVVSMIEDDQNRVVIDGFHRTRVAKECKDITERLYGYTPVVTIRESQADLNNRVASTIRHNRARGKHKVESMSDIVADLKKRNWSPKKIGKELGMDQDEVLRLSQISGLTELFKDEDFSKAWIDEETQQLENEEQINDEK